MMFEHTAGFVDFLTANARLHSLGKLSKQNGFEAPRLPEHIQLQKTSKQSNKPVFQPPFMVLRPGFGDCAMLVGVVTVDNEVGVETVVQNGTWKRCPVCIPPAGTATRKSLSST